MSINKTDGNQPAKHTQQSDDRNAIILLLTKFSARITAKSHNQQKHASDIEKDSLEK